MPAEAGALGLADGSNIIRLTDGPGDKFYPVWSPDGTRIAYVSGEESSGLKAFNLAAPGGGNGSTEIYVMDADGTNVTLLTESPGDDLDPNWSPDGGSLVFSSDGDGDLDLYILHIESGELTQLTDSIDDERYPSWRRRYPTQE